jgi:hypothetical protein
MSAQFVAGSGTGEKTRGRYGGCHRHNEVSLPLMKQWMTIKVRSAPWPWATAEARPVQERWGFLVAAGRGWVRLLGIEEADPTDLGLSG